jgi:hypothetical protein
MTESRSDRYEELRSLIDQVEEEFGRRANILLDEVLITDENLKLKATRLFCILWKIFQRSPRRSHDNHPNNEAQKYSTCSKVQHRKHFSARQRQN